MASLTLAEKVYEDKVGIILRAGAIPPPDDKQYVGNLDEFLSLILEGEIAKLNILQTGHTYYHEVTYKGSKFITITEKKLDLPKVPSSYSIN